MKGFKRDDLLFSLCGLNCGLCPMHIGNYCPGCGGGEGNQPCGIARCSLQHGKVEYCHQCSGFPCDQYEGVDVYDSFITHRDQLRDIEKHKAIGAEGYRAEQREKREILNFLLENCNDGRRKNFFCVAVNLLRLDELKFAMEKIIVKAGDAGQTMKDKADYAAGVLKALADRQNVVLKLNKKK